MKKILDFFEYEFHIGKDIAFSLKEVLIVIAVFILTSFLLKLFRRIIYRTLSNDAKTKFKSIFSFFNYFIYLVVILFTFDNIGINVNALFAASAALLVGVGLALQTFIQDIISGIFMIADQAVYVGDVIEVDGHIGRVENIKLRTTRAVTRDNKVLIIPNHKFLVSTVYNWTENGKITREHIQLGVAYHSDVFKVKDILIEVAKSHKSVLKNPEPFVVFDDFGDSALIMKIFFSIGDSFYENIVKSEIRFKIFERFKEEGIEIPFPQRTLSFLNPVKISND